MKTDDALARRGPKIDQPATLSPREQKEILTWIDQGERFPVVETSPEIGPEVKDWLTKLETGEEIQLSQSITDQTGQVLIKPAAPQKPKIVLPLDEPTYVTGFKESVQDSVRWLVEWIKRILMMFPERIAFKKAA